MNEREDTGDTRALEPRDAISRSMLYCNTEDMHMQYTVLLKCTLRSFHPEFAYKTYSLSCNDDAAFVLLDTKPKTELFVSTLRCASK